MTDRMSITNLLPQRWICCRNIRSGSGGGNVCGGDGRGLSWRLPGARSLRPSGGGRIEWAVRGNEGVIVLKRLAIALALLAGCGAAAAAEVALPLAAQRQTMAANLARQVATCSRREDTNHPAFRGCVDWHSAVHGVWALIAYQRATGDRQYQPLVASILAPDRLASERRLLRQSPQFEMPYGRAWFLRLAIDHRKLTGSDDLVPFADEVAGTLRQYYRGRRIDRFAGEYRSDSWALTNLLDYARARGLADLETEVIGWIRPSFVDADPECSYGREQRQFMAICSNWAALVARVLSRADYAAWLSRFIATNGLPSPIERPATDHEFGLNFSRAWGLWDMYEASGRPDIAAAYAAHVENGYRPASNWSGSYLAVGHWVAQFGLYAVQPLFGAAAGRSLNGGERN
ncbi:DUF2891 family protein [Bradyrhizobium aeschynomenes]|uniref:DUF2891 family protein n=1 Tax=Bradyrhizobium aeschynomenes TaxID=2734909 RepID=UPI0015517E44|nr:DUF2891 family protein [Bradyrhizobium aeschynomenes]NPV20423.1 DUF2891 family protein [Bradyrhizobium aeschynomenes]